MSSGRVPSSPPDPPLPADSSERAAFAHRAAHDLQGPLGRILRFAELVAEDDAGTLDAQDRTALEIVCRSAREASSLVDRLLELELAASRALERRPIDPATAIGDALATLPDAPGRSGARVNVEAFGAGTIDADPELLVALLRELLDNALAFGLDGASAAPSCKNDTSAKVSVTVAHTSEGRPLRIEIADGGAGLPAAPGNHPFRGFEAGPRSDGSTGRGLGLTLCRTICDRHGWTLRPDAAGGAARMVIELT